MTALLREEAVDFLPYNDAISIPAYVRDFDSFCRWVISDDFPQRGRICYLNGEVWIDMSPEELYTHGQVRNEFAAALTALSRATRLGRFYPDRTWLTNEEADLSTEPDGTFISRKTWRAKKVRRIESETGWLRLEGTPDMVLEIISRSSVRKDKVVLRRLYWEAGVPEFWLVDARGDELHFDILRHTPKGYVAARKPGGWIKSKVFGKSFRLTVQPDELGDPEYTLEVR